MLTDKSTRRTGPGSTAGRTLDKIPETSFKSKSRLKDTEKTGAEDTLVANMKNMKLSKDELGFLMDYRKLEDLEREKGIKFFECIGDPPATD